MSSIPLGGTLLLMLRRAQPLAPIRVAAVGGLGVAAVAAVLLDLAVHAVAISLVVIASSLSGRFWPVASR